MRKIGRAHVCTLFRSFVLGVDHFGKNLEAGTRGASSKEAAGDVVLACLGNKELSGSVTDTRLAVRKNRGGQQGKEHHYTLRMVEAPEPDEEDRKSTRLHALPIFRARRRSLRQEFGSRHTRRQ